ncbi:MAG: transglycosylase SLT domain-containing protein [Thermoanaerobacteraceae bacterium]|nr:transglycosylase SLT domain-containing protein [Thermoanaerobacteraceae bacterium]
MSGIKNLFMFLKRILINKKICRILTIWGIVITAIILSINAAVKAQSNGTNTKHEVIKNTVYADNSEIHGNADIEPENVIQQYGFTDGSYRSYAVVKFNSNIIGAASSGSITYADGKSVALKLNDGTMLRYSGFSKTGVKIGQYVNTGYPIGVAEGAVTVSAEYDGKMIDPVALLWNDKSQFIDEAKQVEEERMKITDELRQKEEQKQAEEELRRKELLQQLENMLKAQASPDIVDTSINNTANKEEIRKIINNVSLEIGIDPDLITAVASAESDFNPNVVSDKGAQGVMQLMPETAKSLRVFNPFDSYQNIRGGAIYLKSLLSMYNGDIKLALAAYNAGPEAVKQYGGIPPYNETQAYVQSVLIKYQNLRMMKN